MLRRSCSGDTATIILFWEITLPGCWGWGIVLRAGGYRHGCKRNRQPPGRQRAGRAGSIQDLGGGAVKVGVEAIWAPNMWGERPDGLHFGKCFEVIYSSGS